MVNFDYVPFPKRRALASCLNPFTGFNFVDISFVTPNKSSLTYTDKNSKKTFNYEIADNFADHGETLCESVENLLRLKDRIWVEMNLTGFSIIPCTKVFSEKIDSKLVDFICQHELNFKTLLIDILSELSGCRNIEIKINFAMDFVVEINFVL
jgi:hypothetical protein